MTTPVYVGSTLHQNNTTANPSFSFNAGAAAGRTVIVWTLANITDNPVSGVTYGGNAMTAMGAAFPFANLTAYENRGWYLENAPSGSNTVAISASGGSNNVWAEAHAWSGCAASGSFSGYQGMSSAVNSTLDSPTLDIVSATGDLAITTAREFIGFGSTVAAITATSPAVLDYGPTGTSATDFAPCVFEAAGAASVSVGGTFATGGANISSNALIGFSLTSGVSATTVQRRTLGPRVGSRQYG